MGEVVMATSCERSSSRISSMRASCSASCSTVRAREVVKCGFRLADVSQRPLDVRANERLAAGLIQTRTQRSVGGLQPDMERMTIQVGGVGFGGGHGKESFR